MIGFQIFEFGKSRMAGCSLETSDNRIKGGVLPPVYIVSGGTGASGAQVVHTILVQFEKANIPLITIAHVRHIEQIEEVIEQAALTQGTIVHTMVDARLRNALIEMAKSRGVAEIDFMGPLISRLTEALGRDPLGHPGLYRQLHQDYFARVTAIEFTMAHDDSMNPQDWPLAEIVITGVSRVGKTPLSIYLSVLGWKVANIPIILGLPVPQGLFTLDPRRVIGLHIETEKLLEYRKQRELHIGFQQPSPYTDRTKIREELEYARSLFRKGGFTEIDVTYKPIETSADEIIECITGTLKAESHK